MASKAHGLNHDADIGYVHSPDHGRQAFVDTGGPRPAPMPGSLFGPGKKRSAGPFRVRKAGKKGSKGVTYEPGLRGRAKYDPSSPQGTSKPVPHYKMLKPRKKIRRK